MNAMIGWTSMVAIFLAGCTGTVSAPSTGGGEKSLHWDGADWRICKQPDCNVPTRKTVGIKNAPLPVVPTSIRPAPTVSVPEKSTLTILFASGSARIPHLAHADLARWVAANGKDKPVRLFGRTDETGLQTYNDRLARRRAMSVAEALKGLGHTGRIEISSTGRCCYVGGQPRPDDRAKNRRVELEFFMTEKE